MLPPFSFRAVSVFLHFQGLKPLAQSYYPFGMGPWAFGVGSHHPVGTNSKSLSTKRSHIFSWLDKLPSLDSPRPPPKASLVVDIENADDLLRYLRETNRIGKDETPTLRTLRGGVSNKTVLLRRAGGAAWVLKQALPKLRVQADWFSDPARIAVEANALRYLPLVTPANTIPRLLFEDREQHLLAMEAAPEPHENWKERLLAGRVDQDLIRQFGQLLANVHRRSYERRIELFAAFADREFFETLRLEPYYQFTGERVPEAAPFLRDMIAANRTHCVTLVHGDYSPKNILVYQRRLILLDHEVVHVGDPAFDLGFSLTHLLSKGHHLKAQCAAFLAAAVDYWKTYAGEVGSPGWFDGLENRAVNNTIACLLARTSGRSPLEYLSDDERYQQKEVALQLIKNRPAAVTELVADFGRRIEA
jgi:5-methylthioribose kinase